MELVWTHRAKERLKGIFEYIAEDQPLNAQSWIVRILDRVDTLIHQPKSGRVVPEYEHPDIREVIEGDYRIIYLLDDEKISVLTVKHCSHLLPYEIKELS